MGLYNVSLRLICYTSRYIITIPVYYIGDIISITQSSQVKRYTLNALCLKESNTIQYNTYNIYVYKNKD